MKIDWAAIHRERSFKFYTPFFMCFAGLYGLLHSIRLWAYRRGLLKKKRLSGFVISVGNITAGGTGKTPAVAALGAWAFKKGLKPSILSRGYGGKYRGRIQVVSDGSHILTDAKMAGDESLLLAHKLSGTPVVLSPKRYLAGRYAVQNFGSELFIVDDGYQHIQLERDLNLLLLDSADPFGNGHLLPWGPLREPLHQLKRADAFVVTRYASGEGDKTVAFLKAHYPHIPVFFADHVPEKVVFPHQDKAFSVGEFKGKDVVAFAGIGNPQIFKKTLLDLGMHVLHFVGFRDHYPYDPADLDMLRQLKEKSGAQHLLTTEKDWMRIAPVWTGYPDLGYLTIRFTFLPGQEGIFRMIEDAYNHE